MRDRKHATVRVEWNGFEADIDTKIAPLILELWKAGVMTANSCEDNIPEGFVWIQFTTAEDAEQFLNIIGEYDRRDTVNSRYRRMLGEGEYPRDWRYSLGLEDWAVRCDVDENDTLVETRTLEFPDFCFWVSIRFPQSDLRWIVERMRIYNEVALAA